MYRGMDATLGPIVLGCYGIILIMVNRIVYKINTIIKYI